MTDVQQKSCSKVAQQMSATKVCVSSGLETVNRIYTLTPGQHQAQYPCLTWTNTWPSSSVAYSAYMQIQQQQQQQPFYGPLSGTTWVSRYQKKHSPTHHPDHPIFISFFHLPRSIASFVFKLRAWQSFCTTSFHVLFGLPLGLEPSTSYSIHFFTQSVSSFRSTCPYHRNLFCCSINIISSIPSLSLNSLLGTLSYLSTAHPSDHSHLCSLKCHHTCK